MKIYVLVLVLLCNANYAWSQNLYGKITDEAGNALPGASIYIPTLKIGTATNENGSFQIEANKNGAIAVVFSFVGFNTLDTTISSNKEVLIKLKKHQLEEVVIKAIRADENAPIPMVTRSKEEIEEVYQGQDGAFLLERLSPSIIAYSESGTSFSNYGQMRMRGIDQSRINLTLNGVPLNDMIDQGVFFSNFIDFGNSIESVQIQRGVGTTTNGVASYAGSINFESINLQKAEPSVGIQMTAGSFGTRRAATEYHSGLMKNNIAVYGRFSRLSSEGYRDNTSTDAWSYFFSGGWFHKKHVIKFTAFEGRSQNGLAYSPVSFDDIKADPKINYQPENDKDRFGQWMTQLQHIWAINPHTSLTSTAYYSGAGGDFPFTYPVSDQIINPVDSSTSTQARIEGINYPLYNDHLGFMSQISQQNQKFEWHAGIHAFTFQRVNLEQILPNRADAYYHERSEKQELSTFGKANYRLSDFTFFGDLQIRQVDLSIRPDSEYVGLGVPNPEFNWTFLNPKFGVTWSLRPQLELYASAGRSGREPTKVDILGGFNLGTFNLAEVQNSSVNPEYVNDFEFGLRRSNVALGSWNASFDLNGFYMDFENEIAPIGAFVPEGFIQLRKNIPSSQRYGIEGIMGVSDENEMKGINFDFTYMQTNIDHYAPEGIAEVYNNVEQALSPPIMARGEVYFRPIKSLRISLDGRFLDKMYLEPTNDERFTIPQSWILNAGLDWQFYKNGHVQLRAFNLTDALYYVYGAPLDSNFDGNFDTPGYIVQPPLNFLCTVNLKF